MEPRIDEATAHFLYGNDHDSEDDPHVPPLK